MKSTILPIVLVASVAVSACGTTTGSRSGSGALMGAAGGALIGSLSANAGKGALIGAGVGALNNIRSRAAVCDRLFPQRFVRPVLTGYRGINRGEVTSYARQSSHELRWRTSP